jgi:hypothetical protein
VRESLSNPGHLLRLARAGLGFGRAKARSYLTGRRGLLIDRHETHLDVRPEPASVGAANFPATGSPVTGQWVRLQVTHDAPSTSNASQRIS